MASWPGTLPQNQFRGLSDEREVAVVRSNMDAGPAKQRRRFSAAVRTLTVPIILNGAQKQTFDTFFITTLAEGALSFAWTDPVTDSALNLRFTKPPKWVLQVGGSTSARLWQAELPLEILP